MTDQYGRSFLFETKWNRTRERGRGNGSFPAAELFFATGGSAYGGKHRFEGFERRALATRVLGAKPSQTRRSDGFQATHQKNNKAPFGAIIFLRAYARGNRTGSSER